MANFEPGEYMKMFFQSVTQVARKEKVLPIRVEPITFWLLESRICTNNQKVAYVQTPHPSPQEKSENAVNQSKILLRFFLRRGEVCTQATRGSLGLSPIGSTRIFSSKLPVSLTEKQNISLIMNLVSLDFSIFFYIGYYHGTKIPQEQTNSSLFTDPIFPLQRSSSARINTKTAGDLLTASETGLVSGERLPVPQVS